MKYWPAFILLLLVACESNDRPERHGRLLFAAGSYIGEFDLRDGSSAPVISLGDVTIDHLSSFPDGDLLITMRVYSNGRETSTIIRYDLRNNETLTMFPGLMAEYMAGARAVVYDDGTQLIITHRGEAWRDEITIDFHGSTARPAVATLSDNEFLFSGVADGEAMIYRYDVRDDQRVAMPALSSVCSVDGAVWIESLELLMCKSWSDEQSPGRYVLASLQGELRAEPSLVAEGTLRAVAYLPDQGLVVLTQRLESWAGGQSSNSVWIYDVRDDSSYEIAKDQYLGSAVVYRP